VGGGFIGFFVWGGGGGGVFFCGGAVWNLVGGWGGGVPEKILRWFSSHQPVRTDRLAPSAFTRANYPLQVQKKAPNGHAERNRTKLTAQPREVVTDEAESGRQGGAIALWLPRRPPE